MEENYNIDNKMSTLRRAPFDKLKVMLFDTHPSPSTLPLKSVSQNAKMDYFKGGRGGRVEKI